MKFFAFFLGMQSLIVLCVFAMIFLVYRRECCYCNKVGHDLSVQYNEHYQSSQVLPFQFFPLVKGFSLIPDFSVRASSYLTPAGWTRDGPCIRHHSGLASKGIIMTDAVVKQCLSGGESLAF